MIISTSPGFLRQNFISQEYLIRDTSLTSPNYFDITFFPDQIGGGISLIKLRGNEDNLAFDKPTQVEILDGQGTPVRHEIATHIDRFQNYYVSIYVYDTTAPGIGSVSIVGVAKREPRGEIIIDQSQVNDLGHNLIWTRPITILPTERNNSELVFDDPPFVSVAQVITPARVAYGANVDTQYSAITASNLTISTTKFRGFDKKRGSNFSTIDGVVKALNKDKIVDNKIKETVLNIGNQSKTVNYVEKPTRIRDVDVVGGFILNEETRYNTVLTADSSFFSSSYIGGTLEFFTSSFSLTPNIPPNYELGSTNPYDGPRAAENTQSIEQQLDRWSANIVKIKNDRTAYLDQPVQVNLRRASIGQSSRGYETTHTFYNVTAFTASMVYSPDSLLYTTSSEVSQSYLQFTIQDLKPIGGQVHKIRVYYRRGSEVGDWELLQDQLVSPTEFLTDGRYPNQTNYGLDISDNYLTGHFTEQSVINDNWETFLERANTFDTTASLLDNTTLLNSVRLFVTDTYVYPPNGQTYDLLSTIFTTKYFQNYADDSVYTLSFNCILGPYAKLELYENSLPISTTVVNESPYPTAFDKSKNYKLSDYRNRFNRYGKLIGKVTNNTSTTKDYTRLVFDFKTDREGLGRPLFRVIPSENTNNSTAFVSQISVTPRQLNGYTPRTIQFAFPAKLDTNIDLSETIDYKLEYYDYTGNQSEYISYLEDVRMELATEIPTTACQAEQLKFTFTPDSYISCSSIDYEVGVIPSSSIAASGSIAAKYYPTFLYYTSNYAWWAGIPDIKGLGSADDAVTGRSFWNMQRPFKDFASDPVGTMSYFDTWLVDGVDGTQGLVTSSWRYADIFTLFYDYSTGDLANYINNRASAKGAVVLPSFEHFTASPGVGITIKSVSQSYADFANATTDAERTVALKKRRLYWPASGPARNQYFTENGGIYNVKFRIKQFPGYIYGLNDDYYPNGGSYLKIFIHNVNANFTVSSSGADGWYPPDQNIVKVGHGYSVGGSTTPFINFFDAGTGYYYDEYSINLVQYGNSGQLVFEPSGEDGNYFGVIIDNIEFCKIGTTTDPEFIKPGVVNSSALNIANYIPPLRSER